MEVGNESPIKGLGTNIIHIGGSFQTNGTSDPSSSTFRSTPGCKFNVTYSATGVFTIVFDPSITFPDRPYCINITKQGAVLATDWFDAFVLGEFNRTTRTLVIQAHRSGTGNAPANTAGNRINFDLFFRNSTGK